MKGLSTNLKLLNSCLHELAKKERIPDISYNAAVCMLAEELDLILSGKDRSKELAAELKVLEEYK